MHANYLDSSDSDDDTMPITCSKPTSSYASREHTSASSRPITFRSTTPYHNRKPFTKFEEILRKFNILSSNEYVDAKTLVMIAKHVSESGKRD